MDGMENGIRANADNAAQAEEMAATAEELSAQADGLGDVIAFFQVDGRGEGAGIV